MLDQTQFNKCIKQTKQSIFELRKQLKPAKKNMMFRYEASQFVDSVLYADVAGVILLYLNSQMRFVLNNSTNKVELLNNNNKNNNMLPYCTYLNKQYDLQWKFDTNDSYPHHAIIKSIKKETTDDILDVFESRLFIAMNYHKHRVCFVMNNLSDGHKIAVYIGNLLASIKTKTVRTVQISITEIPRYQQENWCQDIASFHQFYRCCLLTVNATKFHSTMRIWKLCMLHHPEMIQSNITIKSSAKSIKMKHIKNWKSYKNSKKKLNYHRW